ncbi:hypothetical protein ACTFIT_001917 [Dictyostelium discoideum]
MIASFQPSHNDSDTENEQSEDESSNNVDVPTDYQLSDTLLECILKKDEISELNKIFNFPSNFQVNVAPFGTPEGITPSSALFHVIGIRSTALTGWPAFDVALDNEYTFSEGHVALIERGDVLHPLIFDLLICKVLHSTGYNVQWRDVMPCKSFDFGNCTKRTAAADKAKRDANPILRTQLLKKIHQKYSVIVKRTVSYNSKRPANNTGLFCNHQTMISVAVFLVGTLRQPKFNQ